MKHTPSLILTTCADDRCLCPAEQVDDYKIPDSEGRPVRHRIVVCLQGHRYHVIGEGDPPRGTVPKVAS